MARSIEASPLVPILRWSARLGSLASIAFVLLFVFGDDSPRGPDAREWIGILFFPVGVCAGLLLAWWREAMGAWLAASSLAGFYLIYGVLIGGRVGGPWFALLTSPALLFFGSWLLDRQAEAFPRPRLQA